MVIGWICSRDLLEKSWEGLHEVLPVVIGESRMFTCVLLLPQGRCYRNFEPLVWYRPLSVGGNAIELEDRTMGCSLHDNRLHCSMAIFFCPVLQFRGFDVTSERGLYERIRRMRRSWRTFLEGFWLRLFSPLCTY